MGGYTKMETQNELETEIGTTEQLKQNLQPAKVKIVKAEIVNVEKANSKKVNCEVKHPDKDETIKLSSVAYLQEKKVVTKGLWFNQDDEGKIQKGSALAVFLNETGSNKVSELEGKEVDTELDGNFLCFKVY